MEAGNLGERALIRLLTKHFAARQNALGLADDCAAVPWGDGYLLATVDTLSASTHFPAAMTPRQAGRMAATASLSDLAAKGGTPLGLLLALGVPPSMETQALEELAEGFASMADQAGAEVLGGDTKAAGELSVSVTALGTVGRDQLLPRVGVRNGDTLAVTGTLGGAGAGLAALERGLGAGLARRLLEPVPRLAEGRALAASGAARACIDLSDGLASGLHQLAAVNRCGFEVDPSALPVDALARAVGATPEEARGWALQAGGDYELLVALAPERVGHAVAAVEHAGGRLVVVGRAIPDGGVWVRSGAGRETLPDEGWDAFRA